MILNSLRGLCTADYRSALLKLPYIVSYMESFVFLDIDQIAVYNHLVSPLEYKSAKLMNKCFK